MTNNRELDKLIEWTLASQKHTIFNACRKAFVYGYNLESNETTEVDWKDIKEAVA